MKAYNSKVVTIHAEQFDPDSDEDIEGVKFGGMEKMFEDKTDASRAGQFATPYYLEGQHGDEGVWPGDWVIRGLENELYPCKDSVFQREYALAE